MSHPRYQPGTTVAGHYTVTGILGSGGTANVYLARDTVMNRTVAVKVLSGEITPTASRNFMTEARAAAVLSHPNVVNVYDVLEVSGEMYIIMEYICGITLREYLDYHGHLSVKESVNCARQILHALHAAHSRGIVHRDIKPGNILITTEGRIKVTDFGIARLPDRDSFLMPDRTVGTVQYVSPEQAGGGAVDERSDLYSLGVLMYEMLTGSVPFEAERPADIAMMHLSKKPEPPTYRNPNIPGAVEKIVLCALEKDPAARFDGAADMLRVLDRLPDDLLTGQARPLREEGSAYRLATERQDEHTAPIPKARFRRRYLPEDPMTEEIEVVGKRPEEKTPAAAPSPSAAAAAPAEEVQATPTLYKVETPKTPEAPRIVPREAEAMPPRVDGASVLDSFTAQDTLDIMLSPGGAERVTPPPTAPTKEGELTEPVVFVRKHDTPPKEAVPAPVAEETRPQEEKTPPTAEEPKKTKGRFAALFGEENKFFSLFMLIAALLLAVILLVGILTGDREGGATATLSGQTVTLSACAEDSHAL